MTDRLSCSMGYVDKLHASTVAKKANEMKKALMRKRKREAEVKKLFKKVGMEETSDSSSVSSGSSVSEEDFQGCSSPAKSLRKRRVSKNTKTPALTTTWEQKTFLVVKLLCPSLLQPQVLGILSQRYPPLPPRCIVGGERTEKLKQSALKEKSSMIRLPLFATSMAN